MTTTTRRRAAARTRRGSLAVLVAIAMLVGQVGAPSSSAWAGPTEDARPHYQKGKQLFDAGDFKAAIAEFAAADGLAPSPVLQFNIALAYERLGDKAEAVRRYRLYLQAMPEAQNRAAVEEKVKRMSDELAAEQADAARGADQPIEPPLGGAVGGRPDGFGSAPGPAAPAGPATGGTGGSTGDPELDRVAGIDVRGVRDERRSRGQIGGPAMAATGTGPQASGPAATPGPDGAGRAGATAPAEAPAKAKPVYKQWWFWVIVGVSAIILVDIASSDPSDDPAARALQLTAPGTSPATGAGGAVLMRF